MEFLARYFLTALILFPLVGTIVIRTTRGRLDARWVALGATLLTFILSLLLLFTYDWHDPANGDPSAYAVRDGAHPAGVVQLVCRIALIPALHLQYFVGIDGLSLPLVLLTTFICALVAVALWNVDTKNVEKQGERYFTLLLLTEAASLAAFLSLNFVFFFLFFVLSLLPIRSFIQLSGGPRKQSAQAKFSAAMVISSIALLIVMIGVGCCAGNFDLVALPALLREKFAPGGPLHGAGKTLFIVLMAALLIRLAVFPLHTWLADVHVEVAAPISMILPALIQASGAYGIFRIAQPLFPDAARSFWLVFAVIGVANIFYGPLCAMFQTDIKRLTVFTLIPQSGFVLLGAAVMTPAAVHGATFMIFSQALTGPMLFFLAGMLIDRARHRNLSRLAGRAHAMPVFLMFSIVGFLAALGLPALCTFVGQVLVLIGTFQATGPGSALISAHAGIGWIYAVAISACAGTLINAAGMLSVGHRIVLNPGRAESGDFPDADQREIAVLTPLAVMVVLLGVLPTTIYFNFARTTVEAISRAVDFAGQS